jgi:cell division protein FtsI/penicillin-binding protein 2
VEKGTGAQLKKIFVNAKGEYEAGLRLPDGAKSLLAGKTGTAETVKEDADHSWFVAVAPLPKPRYAVAVIVEHGGLGAKTAGPIAVEVMLEALKKSKYK